MQNLSCDIFRLTPNKNSRKKKVSAVLPHPQAQRGCLKVKLGAQPEGSLGLVRPCAVHLTRVYTHLETAFGVRGALPPCLLLLNTATHHLSWPKGDHP